MPDLIIDRQGELRHSDDVQDIITATPSCLLRWGITVFFTVLVMLLSLCACVKYPDVVKTPLRITSTEASRPVVPKMSGRIIRILAKDGEPVQAGQSLAFLESTADHVQVLALSSKLNTLQRQELSSINPTVLNQIKSNRLGELQGAYQTFLHEMLNYRAATDQGSWQQKKQYLKQEMHDLDAQITQLNKQKRIQQEDLDLATDEYAMHKQLAVKKVETTAEFRQQESRYLAKKASLVQLEGLLISANTNKLTKQKEILELNNQIKDESAKFSQALNSLISQVDDWESKYVLTSPQIGKLAFAGIVQPNQVMEVGKAVFYVSSGNGSYFGEIHIPQDNMGKIQAGQKVLVKLKSYPFEQYGMLTGSVKYIADVPYNDSIFMAKVALKDHQLSFENKQIILKEGLLADAEIITEDATLLQRFTRNITKAMSNR